MSNCVLCDETPPANIGWIKYTTECHMCAEIRTIMGDHAVYTHQMTTDGVIYHHVRFDDVQCPACGTMINFVNVSCTNRELDDETLKAIEKIFTSEPAQAGQEEDSNDRHQNHRHP
jgi:hypothetical protein